MPATEYITPDQLVERWKGAVTTGTLANWRSQGRGPAFTRIAKRVRYRVVDVLAYEKTTQRAAGMQPSGEA